MSQRGKEKMSITPGKKRKNRKTREKFVLSNDQQKLILLLLRSVRMRATLLLLAVHSPHYGVGA